MNVRALASPLAARWITGITFITWSLLLAWYYFTFAPENLKVIQRTHSTFYRALDPAWLQPNVSDLQEVLRSGTEDNFSLLLMRTAMGFWRIREQAPHSYDRFISSLKDGLWSDKFVSNLTAALQELDQQWIRARQARYDRNINLRPHANVIQGQGFGIQFPPGTTTADVGSLITVTFAVEEGSAPQPAVQAYWERADNPGVKAHQYRSCTCEDTGKTSGTAKLYRLQMDLSDSPEWLYIYTEPTWIHFRGSGEVNWRPQAYGFGDSDLLAIPKNR